MNTHDTPTFAGFLKRVRDPDCPEELKANLLAFSFRAEPDREELLRWLAYLLQSRAALVIINLEDLWLEAEPQNVPGSGDRHPNWRRKCALAVDTEAVTDSELLAEIGSLRHPDSS